MNIAVVQSRTFVAGRCTYNTSHRIANLHNTINLNVYFKIMQKQTTSMLRTRYRAVGLGDRIRNNVGSSLLVKVNITNYNVIYLWTELGSVISSVYRLLVFYRIHFPISTVAFTMEACIIASMQTSMPIPVPLYMSSDFSTL